MNPRHEPLVVKRVTRRLIPFAFLCYVVAYIDRVNIGFAADALQRDLGLSDAAYGVGAGLFFLGYCLFEIPSNLILERVGARRWMARIMVLWGLVSMGTMFVTDTTTFYVARVLLGIAEAGFFPGMVLYLTYWIPAAERARTGALFMMAAPIAMIVGAPASEALLKLDGLAGLRGWQWLFVIEGLPAVILGVAALWVLTDRPEQATWLSGPERAWLADTMRRERADFPGSHQGSLLRSLASGKVWLLAAIYFLNALVTYGIFLWLPRILRESSGLDGFALSAITAVPFAAALVGMVVIGRHSDRYGRAQVARGGMCVHRGGRVAGCGDVSVQPAAARPRLHTVSARTTLDTERFLGDSADVPGRRGCGRRHRAHQLDRQSRRGRRAIGHGLASGRHLELQRGSAGARWCARARSGPGHLVAASRTRQSRSHFPGGRRLDSSLPAPAVQGIVGRSIIVSYNFVVSAIMSDNNVGSTP